MLKIKDEVDLKELEKFGFKKHEWIVSLGETRFKYIKNVKSELVMKCKPYWINEKDVYSEITITQDRDITLQTVVPILNLDTLYDLIQAGLVEKVSD